MNNIAIIESFTDLKNEKFIDRPSLMMILEDVLRSAVRKQFGQDVDFDIIMNPDNGDMEIWRNFNVVEDGEVENSDTEIQISEVQKIESDFEVGEEYSVEVKISELERRTILSLRQNLKSKISDFQSKLILEQFTDLVNEMYNAEVHLIKRDGVILIDDDSNEIFLPKQNQIPGDFFKKGENVKGIIESVTMKSGKPNIIMSRTSDVFLERLMEMEIPEVMDGLITIKNVKRIPGSKAKVIVESYDDRIDPVGSCVGVRGTRINSIVKELNNEYIDVINWTENKRLLITRALNPAKINNINVDETTNYAFVEMNSEEVSKAVGKGGMNIRLASLITGFKIDIDRHHEIDEDDVSISDFNDEIDQWVIDELIKVGLDTAKSVLRLTPEYLQKVTDLEEETIEDIIKILKSEFE
jgi:transcription termination/antitermination protein NusA